MRLVYEATGKEVKVGDIATTIRGEKCEVKYFKPPHKPGSEGKITVQEEGCTSCSEFYVSVIGAKWIEREDRQDVKIKKRGKDEFCINTTDAGSIWGKMSDWAEINKVAKSNTAVEYLGNYMTWDDNSVYAVFHTEEINYIVKIE